MTTTSTDRRQEIIRYCAVHGVPKTIKKFPVNEETIRRYKRAELILGNIDAPVKKILIFDIETAPMKGYFWGTKKQYINPPQILEDWSILCWAAKWLDGDEIFTDATWLTGKKVRDDKKISKSLANMLSAADIVVAHYGDGFDIKRLNTRLLFHNLAQPTPYKSIDTCKISKSMFSVTSNSLDFLGDYLKVGCKVKHQGFQMWIDVLNGCKKAQQKMLEYNVGDITLLEDVYLKLRHWDKRHPNVNVQFDKIRCPVCGSRNLRDIDDVYTPVAKYSAKVCKDCGKYSRTAQHKKTKEEMGRTQRNVV